MKGFGLFIFLSLLGCGLDTVNFLQNPDVITQTEDGLLSWNYDPADYSSTNFLGYEVFYKYYVENVSANYGASDADALRTNNGVDVVPTPERLLSLGYQRANLDEFVQNNEPVVLVNPGDLGKNLRFELDFRDLLNAAPDVKEITLPLLRIIDTAGPTTISTNEFRRGARSYDGVSFRQYWEVYDQTFRLKQPNVESHLVTALNGNPSGIWIVFFVMTYGWSPENGREISEPVLLGTIKTFTLTWP